MELEKLPFDFTVCKIPDISRVDPTQEFCFTGRTDEEFSLVCRTEDVPENVITREDGWKGFRIQGMLDFSLIGILADISGVLAENNIGIFVISTFNTDYIFVKAKLFDRAMNVLETSGYVVL